jgi:hypothetical protein
MITNTTQKWRIGEVVQVGFVKGLRVTGIEPQEGYPDCYRLEGKNGAVYEFVPHYGLNLIKPATAQPSKIE